MRVALIADVHGNIAALDAVLEDIERQCVDSVVNLGDLLSGGLHPRRTADRLMALGFPTIAGNHDRYLLEQEPDSMGSWDRHAHDQLDDEHRRWLGSLPFSLELGNGILAVHGTPTDDQQYFLHSVDPHGSREATEVEIIERAAGFTDRSVIACAHTHLQRHWTLPSGTLVVNPGSVGAPAYDDDQPYPHVMESGSPHARYAVLDDHDTGSWTVSFERVEYDHGGAADDARAHGMTDIADALLTGFVGLAPCEQSH
ncbi:metallophosphoesterase family protein [Rhodococcus fascians]|nr:metallophosphoesterase family protein [Rhodococcus fascians]MBY4239930.1 metallophosphoesterase family protein [Rhodococcus fascians]MBY4255534.1 metallophosphoesterase family protein [Rhodococcus fascians]MBY4271275.1 metallophosphoesterase family protein [Rhodococcus fascians]